MRSVPVEMPVFLGGRPGADRIAKDPSIFGRLLETFVFSEVLKQASWFGESCALYHYRDKDQGEVDLVIETGSGALVGIESPDLNRLAGAPLHQI